MRNTNSPRPTYTAFTASSSSTISPTAPSPESDGQVAKPDSSNDAVKGAVGISAFIATLIFTFVYCRYFRKRRTQAKIERIMQRSEPPQIVQPDSVHSTNHISPPASTATLAQQNNPNDSRYRYHPLPPIPAEQQMPEEHEMAHIEMQRQQLAPPPLIAHSMEGIAQPMAPPVSMTEASGPPRRFTAQLTSQAAPPSSTSSLASPPERAHPFARFQDPFGTQQFEEHGHGHDVSVYAQKQPHPYETSGLPQRNYYSSSSSPSQLHSAGSSSGVTPGRYGYHQQPSPRPEKDHDRFGTVSPEVSAPPPSYIESMALQLAPSAPSPSTPSNEPPTDRG
ncbi:hypothetical protein BGZ74_003044 [Mortierella antarctica]|nr:hypothetical protein BGZ74_003044 [Mortierella antarctica]